VDAVRDISTLALAALRPGLRLGDFLLLAPLGRGAQSEVWEARQLSDHRRVALKLLAPALAACAEGLQRFRQEASVQARLAHPYIAAILAAGEACGRPYLAQELVPGGRTLAHDIAAARHEMLPPLRLPRQHFRDAAALFAHVADALHAAHEAGLLHLDVKPGNILVTPTGQPRLADFGCATDADGAASRDGTPAYSSPERLAGAAPDRRSDVFALGATLYEALTLRRAFDGASMEAVRAAVRAGRPLDPRMLRPEIPRGLAAVALRCLRAAPMERYATAGDVGDELRRFLDRRATLAGGGAWRRAVEWWRLRAAG
jgi:eukaryotic-like serine/threonine-protein kinase